MSFGIVDGTYFVGRFELLAWLNELLGLDYAKVEECATGAAYCQIMDAIYPGRVPLHQVKFDANYDYEMLKNYKILQQVFDRIGLDKKIDANKLTKAKYQDNLELLQWFKRYYEVNASGDEYDGEARRRSCKSGAGRAPARKTKRTGSNSSSAAAAGSAGGGATRKSLGAAGARARAARSAESGESSNAAPRRRPTTTTTTNTNTNNSGNAARARAAPARTRAAPARGGAAASSRIRSLEQTVAEQQATIESQEKELLMYFGKLRSVEIVCQELEAKHPEVISQILAKLYAEDPDPVVLSELSNNAQ